MLYIIDNNLLDIDNSLYDLFKNCIKKLNIDIVSILIIEYDKFYYYKNYNYRDNKLSFFMETKYEIDYENMYTIIRNTEIYCFYQENFNNYYESILFDCYENYFNQDLNNISIIYFLNNSLNYYEEEPNIEYNKSKLINTFINNCSKNIYIINKYHKKKPFRYITNCMHKINHIYYYNDIYNKNKHFFLSNYINKYLNWIKISYFDKYELLDIMFHSITIIIYISYYDNYKLNELIHLFENVFNNEKYNYALTYYLNNYYLNNKDRFKNISILLNFKIFINNYNIFSEINKVNNNKINNKEYLFLNNKYFENSYIFKIKNKKNYELNNDNYIKLIIKKKFPYIDGLINNNICVAGGFLRSIILNQTVNDIDFFIYGHVENYFLLINNFITYISKYFKNKYIIHLYKPKNKVLEIIITSSIDIIIKIQLILVNNKDIESLLLSFDINPCKIAYNGINIIRTEECIDSYKYLINDIRNIDITKCNNIDYRIKKYLNYGFDLVIDYNDFEIKLNTIIKISNNLIANVLKINENIIEIDLINNNYF